jgi:EAL domain-containing protein (putative c-di-GMP-specific phosphodiesterase class I)
LKDRDNPWEIQPMFDIDSMVEDHAPAVQPRTAAAMMEPKFFCTVTPFYQPIVSADGFGVIGYEALARGPLDSPLHSARTLFATANGLGEMAALERVCWTTALLNATRLGLWRRPDTLLFLNLSAERIREPEFFDFARRVVAETGVPVNRLVLEVTEESRMRSDPGFLRALMRYREMGFQIALDDVGTGYSDLRVLAEVRPDFLKIALELVRGVHAHTGRRQVVHSLVMLGHAMGSTVIVEGVETSEELAAVRALGADCVQGHLMAKPGAGLPAVVLPDTLAVAPRLCRAA